MVLQFASQSCLVQLRSVQTELVAAELRTACSCILLKGGKAGKCSRVDYSEFQLPGPTLVGSLMMIILLDPGEGCKSHTFAQNFETAFNPAQLYITNIKIASEFSNRSLWRPNDALRFVSLSHLLYSCLHGCMCVGRQVIMET